MMMRLPPDKVKGINEETTHGYIFPSLKENLPLVSAGCHLLLAIPKAAEHHQVSRPRICPSWLISPGPDKFKRASVTRIHHSLYPVIRARDAEMELKLTLLEVEDCPVDFVPTNFLEFLDLEDAGMHHLSLLC